MANAAIDGSLSSARWEKTLGIIWKTIIVTNPCFFYIQAHPKDSSRIYSFHVHISPSNYSLIYFPVKGQSITPTHHFQGKKDLISLFSNSFQKGGFKFSPQAPHWSFQTVTASFPNKGIIQIVATGQMVIHNMQTAFPRIYCTFFKF